MERGRGLRRIGRPTVVVGGLALGIAVIGIALALVIVQLSGTVSSNEFVAPTSSTTTTTTTIPPGDGLEAAFVANGFDCPTQISSGILTFGASAFDLNSASSQPAASPNFLCAVNAGTGPITTLTVTATAATTSEIGCSAEEGAVDPEGATCGTQGELADILEVGLLPAGSSSSSCQGSFTVPLGVPTELLSSNLMPGASCAWTVSFALVASATDAQKLAASTDGATFNLDVAGS